eukprot:CAMPEP_0197856452 /NCGR_PEP_ID=MMETSP1438-20131217/28589_1 /TAXON_ID=1461541 /ORGANISM="Pterosperma sp., Strain CCMP1384" /LENGTH=211 /DNA_ID=CAMNT_0043471909 /DNA_START=268 /DNA_END=903 /DNA_ORIENTATION=+
MSSVVFTTIPSHLPPRSTPRTTLLTRGRGANAVVQTRAAAGWQRYGVTEKQDSGAFQETYGLNLGKSIGRETLTFPAGASAVAVDVKLPMGMVLEEVTVEGKQVILAVDINEGSNAETAGVQVGDILRMTSAVAKGKVKVEVGRFQVEPSLGMEKKGDNRKAYFIVDGSSFGQVMNALVSNAEPVPGADEDSPLVNLLLERRVPIPEWISE